MDYFAYLVGGESVSLIGGYSSNQVKIFLHSFFTYLWMDDDKKMIKNKKWDKMGNKVIYLMKNKLIYIELPKKSKIYSIVYQTC